MVNGVFSRQGIGIGNGSSSLANVTPPLSGRLQCAAFVTGGKVIVYGDEATLDFWDALNVLWGTSQPIQEQYTEGYQYIWNINQKKLFVISQNGSVERVKNIKTISDLAIDMDIVESHAFQIVIDSDLMAGSGYLIGRRVIPQRPCDQEAPAKLIDQSTGNLTIPNFPDFKLKFVQGNVSLPCMRKFTYRKHLQVSSVYAGEKYLDRTILPEERWKISYMWQNYYNYQEDTNLYFTANVIEITILYALIQKLRADGYFPQNYLIGGREFPAEKLLRFKNGVIENLSYYLMVRIISTNLKCGSNPVFEPWMLWVVWRWLGQGSNVVTEERIFDLSPNWGG